MQNETLANLLTERLQASATILGLRNENADLKKRLEFAEANNAIFAARLLDLSRGSFSPIPPKVVKWQTP